MKTKEKRTSIRAKLSRQVVIMVTITLLLLSNLACYAIDRIITGSSRNQLLTEAKYFESEIEGWTSGIIKEVNTVLATVKSTGLAKDSNKLLQFLKDVTLDLNEDIPAGLYAGTEKGEYLDPSGWVPDASYNVKERGWYIQGKDNVTMEFGAPYYGDNLKSNMVSASARVDDNTILATDVVLGSIENVINEMKISGNGYGFVVDTKSGFIVAHKNQEYTGKLIQDIDDAIVQEAYKSAGTTDDLISVKDGDDEYYLTINNVKGTNWALVTCANKDVVYKSLITIIIGLALVSLVFTIIIGVVIYIRVKKITAPLEGITSIIAEITKGNLTVQPVVEGNDEIAEMSKAMNQYIHDNRIRIAELISVSDVLMEEAGGSADVSNRMNEASGSQTEAMGQLNITVEELAKSIEEIANDATVLAATAADANEYGSNAKNMIDETVNATDKGKDAISKVSEKMNTMNETMKQLEQVVKEVGESSNEINSITAMIGSIADQTNLLALNANIEAARAGEAGKGFAVVASEIGNLATSSTDAVKQIEVLINKVCMQVEEVVSKTKDSVQDIGESKALVEHTSETFLNIYDKVNHTATALEAVTKKVQHVDNVAANMAAITEEQSAGTEEILATSESVYKQSVAITRGSEILKETADKLHVSAESIKEYTEKFTI